MGLVLAWMGVASTTEIFTVIQGHLDALDSQRRFMVGAAFYLTVALAGLVAFLEPLVTDLLAIEPQGTLRSLGQGLLFGAAIPVAFAGWRSLRRVLQGYPGEDAAMELYTTLAQAALGSLLLVGGLSVLHIYARETGAVLWGLGTMMRLPAPLLLLQLLASLLAATYTLDGPTWIGSWMRLLRSRPRKVRKKIGGALVRLDAVRRAAARGLAIAPSAATLAATLAIVVWALVLSQATVAPHEWHLKHGVVKFSLLLVPTAIATWLTIWKPPRAVDRRSLVSLQQALLAGWIDERRASAALRSILVGGRYSPKPGQRRNKSERGADADN